MNNWITESGGINFPEGACWILTPGEKCGIMDMLAVTVGKGNGRGLLLKF